MNQQLSKLVSGLSLRESQASIRTLELASIVFWIMSASWAGLELGRSTLQGGPAAWVALGLAGAFGWVLADGLSGTVHYFADNFGAPHWPLVGPALIASFREHHEAPHSITRHDFVERSGMLCLAALLLGGWVGFFLQGAPSTPLRVGVGALALSTATWISLTGEIHAWAHGLTTPRWGKVLQALGLVLSPSRHAPHHAGTHSSHYCITSGFWDRFLFSPARRWIPLKNKRIKLDS